MCGLAGFARHPKAPNLALSIGILTTLLEKNERRGHHATGVAAVGGAKPFLLKKACEAAKFVRSAPYAERVLQLAPNTPVVLGHTRHATHRNAHEDEAAHPFHIGKVIGAHNGMIHNWREVEAKVFAKNDGHTPWINDSQAAFAVLDKWADPLRGTDKLDGWWALTWTRDKMLYMTRTSGVELHAAYVGPLRTLFWSSEFAPLSETLKGAGIDQFDIWKINANTIYRYDPTQFTEESANATKKDAPFRGIGQARRGIRLGASGRGDDVKKPIGGYSTSTTYPSGRKWDSTSAREIEAPVEKSSQAKLETMGTFGGEMQRLWDFVAKMNSRLGALAADNEALRVEVDWLYEVLNEKYGEVFEVEANGDDATGTPYKEPATCDPRQMDLVDEIIAKGPPSGEFLGRCVECGGSGGSLLRLPDGGYVHDSCVLVS